MNAVLLQVTNPISLLTTEPSQPDDQLLLFFDGGSRGNPGAGGAGACIIKVTQGSPSIVWAQATYLPAPTTNNFAELTGAMSGLQQLRSMAPHTCTIVGDSNKLITLFRRHKVPKAFHLQDLFRRARRTADGLHIKEWRHHFRVHNSMADALANFAMDHRTTTTLWPERHPPLPPARSQLLTTLRLLCTSDLQPWLLSAADWRQP